MKFSKKKRIYWQNSILCDSFCTPHSICLNILARHFCMEMYNFYGNKVKVLETQVIVIQKVLSN